MTPLTNADRLAAWWGAHRYIGEAERLIPIQAVRPRYRINLAAEKVSPQGPAGASAARFNSPAGPLNNLATSKTQPLDRIRPLPLLLETLGWTAVLGLAFGFVILLGLRVGAI